MMSGDEGEERKEVGKQYNIYMHNWISLDGWTWLGRRTVADCGVWNNKRCGIGGLRAEQNEAKPNNILYNMPSAYPRLGHSVTHNQKKNRRKIIERVWV